MIKKTHIILIAISAIVSLLLAYNVLFEKDEQPVEINPIVEMRVFNQQQDKQIRKNLEFNQEINIEIAAKSAILIDADDDKVLFENNSDEMLAIASMSKVMSQLIVLESIKEGEIKWADPVPLSDYAIFISNKAGYSSIKLSQDKEYTVKDLFQGMSISSANGATIALAEFVAGTEKNFVKLMNEKAQNLNLTNSKFYNSTGITNEDLGSYMTVGNPNDANKMSAWDMGRLASHLIKEHEEILEITKQPWFEIDGSPYFNSNLLLENNKFKEIPDEIYFEGVDGLKTGYTKLSKYCFAGTVKISGKRYISVVIGAEDRIKLFSETKKLYDEVKKSSVESLLAERS